MALSGPRAPHLVNATDIEQWAEQHTSRTELARLARNLIDQTGDQVTRNDIRAGEGAEVPGYDGVVEAAKGTPFVPSGRSVWELGTGDDPRAKAEEDYKNRTASPLGEICADTTYVVLTPRRWNKKAEWIKQKKDEGSPWKDIRVFDVDDIEAALERAPGVHFAFSDQLGNPAYGVLALEDWWNRFRTGSSPMLTNELVLAGRQPQASALLTYLNEDRNRTTISAASADDVLAFVAATIASVLDEGARLNLFGRTLIVRDARSLQILERGAKLLILLPYSEDLYREAEQIRANQVILLGQPGAPAEIQLPPIDQEVFAKGLKERMTAGLRPDDPVPHVHIPDEVDVSDERARVLARAAGRSLVAYMRLAGAPGVPQRPGWTGWFQSVGIRRAWLAGSWNQGRSGDTDVVSTLAGNSYAELERELRPASKGEDPLFTAVGDIWGVASAEAAWDFVRPHLTTADLKGLEQSVQTVLGAVDPALDPSLDQRWAAALHGNARVQSNNLRTGLSTTLALLGAFGDAIDLGSGATGKTWAERLVSHLLRRANDDMSGQLWSSLADVLPLLAEAAPDAFLNAATAGATGPDAVLSHLFLDQQDQGFAVSSPHTGLLWALEALAWSPDHVGLAAEALARLAEIDPGGRLSNRPRGSLTDVFRPWMPQTSTDVDSRIAIVDSIASRHPDIAWSLLLSLLPEVHGVATPTYTARFRSWKPEKEAQVVLGDYWKAVNAAIDGAFRLAMADPARWPDLILRLGELPPDKRREALALIEGMASE
jgi:hypothetical protein